MTALEVIATLFAVLVVVKVTVVVANPQVWMQKVAGPLWSRPAVASGIYAVLAIVVGFYVFASLGIIEVAAVMCLTALLIGLSLLPYSKALLEIAEELTATRSALFRKAWLPMAIWMGIALWVLVAVFA